MATSRECATTIVVILVENAGEVSVFSHSHAAQCVGCAVLALDAEATGCGERDCGDVALWSIGESKNASSTEC